MTEHKSRKHPLSKWWSRVQHAALPGGSSSAVTVPSLLLPRGWEGWWPNIAWLVSARKAALAHHLEQSFCLTEGWHFVPSSSACIPNSVKCLWVVQCHIEENDRTRPLSSLANTQAHHDQQLKDTWCVNHNLKGKEALWKEQLVCWSHLSLSLSARDKTAPTCSSKPSPTSPKLAAASWIPGALSSVFTDPYHHLWDTSTFVLWGFKWL